MKKTSKAVRTRKHSFRRYTAGMLAALMVLGGIDSGTEVLIWHGDQMNSNDIRFAPAVL